MNDDDLTAFARRKTVVRENGETRTTLSYSIPAGVTDAEAAEEIARAERAIARGYTMKCSPDGPFRGGLRTSIGFINKHPRLALMWLYCAVIPSRVIPRAIERAYFWLKCRWLDVYWFVKDRRAASLAKARAVGGDE